MSHLLLTRLIIETVSPMAINSGMRETGFDTQLARDANGLPYIPATSLAGVWRHLASKDLGEHKAADWFGFVEGKRGQSSRLTIADGVLLDSQSQPIQGLILASEIAADPLLSLLAQPRPLHRERVSLNDRGVAKDTGKFDQLLVPSGIRFCIDIKFSEAELSAEKQAEWQQLLSCWQSRFFALGATTRNGLGRIKVIASKQQRLSLYDNPQSAVELVKFAKREQLPNTLDLTSQVNETPLATLCLKALDNWRCGSGEQLMGASSQPNVALMSYSEPYIEWPIEGARLSKKNRVVLTGSSIKGMLAHRVAFHYRRHKNIWAHEMADAANHIWETRPQELSQLFGYADETQHGVSVAGNLIVDDCVVEYDKTLIRQHNAIDRFTGGVRKGALFSEELLYQPEFNIQIWLKANCTLAPELSQALVDTLDDLQQGLLPLGAGSGRGVSLVMNNPNKDSVLDMTQLTVLANGGNA